MSTVLLTIEDFRERLRDVSNSIGLVLPVEKSIAYLDVISSKIPSWHLVDGKIKLPLNLSSQETARIYDALLKNCDKHSYEARQRGKWLNYILYEGENQGLLKAKPVPLYFQGRQKLAIRINRNKWQRHVEFSKLCDFFLKASLKNAAHEKEKEEVDQVCSTIFAIVAFSPVPVNHFVTRLAWLTLEDIDFEKKAIHLSPRQVKRFEKKAEVEYVKNRYYLSDLSFLYINRFILYLLKKKKTSLTIKTSLFPPEVLSRGMGRKYSSNIFRKWLEELTAAYAKEAEEEIKPFRMSEVSDCIKIKLLEKYPGLTLSCSSGSILYDPLHSKDIDKYLGQGGTDDLEENTSSKWINIKDSFNNQPGKSLISHSRESYTYDYVWSIHRRVKEILRMLTQDHDMVARKVLAESIEQEFQLNDCPNPDVRALAPLLSNGFLVWSWICALLRERRIKPKTIKTYSSMMFEVLTEIAGENRILDFENEGDFEELCEEMIFHYESRASARVMKNRLLSFQKFLLKAGYKVPQIDLSRSAYWFPESTEERHIVGFRDFDLLLDRINRLKKYVSTYRMFTILCFFCGLRRNEAARLAMKDISIGKEISLFIRKSKTAHGRRNIPLSYLVPEKYIDEISSYYQARKDAGAGPDDPFLAELGAPGFLDAGNVAAAISKMLKDITGKNLSCHDLRHSCASWLFIRWCVLVFGVEAFKSNPEFETEPFSDYELDKLAFLFLGTRQRTYENLVFAPVVPAISRILGHAGPVITVNTYLHTIEFLQKVIRDRSEKKLTFSRAEGVSLIQCTPPSIFKYFPKSGGYLIDIKDILTVQRTLMERNARWECIATQKKSSCNPSQSQLTFNS